MDASPRADLAAVYAELKSDGADIRSWATLGIAVTNALVDMHLAHLESQREILATAADDRASTVAERLGEQRHALEELRRMLIAVHDRIIALTPKARRRVPRAVRRKQPHVWAWPPAAARR